MRNFTVIEHLISKAHIIEENFIENTKILCMWNLNSEQDAE